MSYKLFTSIPDFTCSKHMNGYTVGFECRMYTLVVSLGFYCNEAFDKENFVLSFARPNSMSDNRLLGA